MANNYQQFSASIELNSEEEAEWLKRVLAAMGDCPDLMMDPKGETDETLVAQWAAFEKTCDPEIFRLLESLVYDDLGDKSYGGTALVTAGIMGSDKRYLKLYEEESCDLEKPVELIHQFFKRFRPHDTYILSWAETCNKMRADQFGGGAVLITADWVYWPPFQLQALANVYTDAKKRGLSISAVDGLSIAAAGENIK